MDGLDKFRDAFADYTDNYVVIGGTACEILMTGTVVRPRATHDIDMILVVEKMTSSFVQRFYSFIKEGGYSPQKLQTEVNTPPKYELYRFVGGREGYPKMIELLARHPNLLQREEYAIVEPISVSDDISNLSAIIMEDDLYRFTISHSLITDHIRHADPFALIAMKAKAYTNLMADRKKGLQVNSHDIKKHRSDVLKNVIIAPGAPIEAPITIINNINEFVSSIRDEWDTLGPSLSASLRVELPFAEELLNQLDELFVEERREI